MSDETVAEPIEYCGAAEDEAIRQREQDDTCAHCGNPQRSGHHIMCKKIQEMLNHEAFVRDPHAVAREPQPFDPTYIPRLTSFVLRQQPPRPCDVCRHDPGIGQVVVTFMGFMAHLPCYQRLQCGMVASLDEAPIGAYV